MLITAWQKSLKILKIFASNSHTRTKKETYTEWWWVLCFPLRCRGAFLFPPLCLSSCRSLNHLHTTFSSQKSRKWKICGARLYVCVQMSRLMCVCWGHFGWSSLCHMAVWKLRLCFRVEIRLQDRPRVKVKHVVVVIRERLMSIKIPHKHRHARTHKTVWSCVLKVCPSLRWCS